MSHAGLVANKGSKMRLLRRIILGEGLDLSTNVAAALARQETERAVTRVLKLAMRLRNVRKDKLPGKAGN